MMNTRYTPRRILDGQYKEERFFVRNTVQKAYLDKVYILLKKPLKCDFII